VLRQLAAGVSGGARLMPTDELKQNAAAAAVELVESGMLVGLGTGSTARYAISLLGERYRQGVQFTGVPTSLASAELARSLGIPVIESPTATPIDLTIDGADEISEADLTLIKGMGGALLREKIVAARSRQMVVVADETKLSTRLSGRVPLPVEVVSFGWESTKARLEALGCRPVLKRDAQGEPCLLYTSVFLAGVFRRNPDRVQDKSVIIALRQPKDGFVSTGQALGAMQTVFEVPDYAVAQL